MSFNVDKLAECTESDIDVILKGTTKELLELAEICKQHYIAVNYVGYLKYHQCSWITEQSARKMLSKDVNQPCVAIKSLWSLYLIKQILCDKLDSYYHNINDVPLNDLRLKLQFLILWQQALVDREQEIMDQSKLLTEKMCELLEKKEDSDEKAKIYLEIAAVHILFYQYDKVDDFVSKASEVCKLNVDLTGMMGKRTRFQQKEIAQLVLVHNDSTSIGEVKEASTDVPQNCNLNDDTLLEKVAVTNEQDAQVDGRTLSEVQLSCLIWIAKHEKMTHIHDVLVHERCTPFLDTVIFARRCWPIQASALLLRADLEKQSGRRVDRSCSQSELVVKLMQGIEDETPEEQKMARVSDVICSGLEPAWQGNVLLAGILKSLGCTSEALLILEKLELWDGVIECYKALGQIEKAESLLRRLIEDKPNDSMLHVYLGDITQNPEYFEKAIELSNDRNARAHRSLGHLLLMKKHFEEAYKHLRRSLELQPIQLGTWFNAGYCAWKLENYKDSTQCYHRCVALQPDHFEAWNNLSAAYIRYGQKEKAWKLLQEALKYNYEHAHVWENYMLLSVDVGSFSQAIQAYHRLLDMNKRGADDEVLELIATQILKREKELTNEEEITENQKEKNDMIKLMARISANHQTLSAKTLRCYAELKKPVELNAETRTEYEKYIQLLEKSLGISNGKQNWSKNEQSSIDVLETACRLSEERLLLANFINSPNSVKEACARIRLSLRGILARIEKDKHERVTESEEISNKMEELVLQAQQIQNSLI